MSGTADCLSNVLDEDIFPMAYLPESGLYIYSISEIIILSNDQHQTKKWYQQTTVIIEGLNKKQ